MHDLERLAKALKWVLSHNAVDHPYYFDELGTDMTYIEGPGEIVRLTDSGKLACLEWLVFKKRMKINSGAVWDGTNNNGVGANWPGKRFDGPTLIRAVLEVAGA